MQIKDILTEIEMFAPLAYQEHYDNCGVQVGDVLSDATGALLTLDVTEAVIEEAIDKECNLIIAHHPLIFSGLKRITGKNFVERSLVKAIRNNITIYAAHTNLDNVQAGVNRKIAEKLGLTGTKILAPSGNNLFKLYTYVPEKYAGDLLNALFAAGAGHIGMYSECSFTTSGTGSFRASETANPVIGMAGGARELVQEVKIEVLVPEHLRKQVIGALKAHHPYEEVAYELLRTENENQTIGSGMTGSYEAPMATGEFFKLVKERLHATCIRHTHICHDTISKVALCGGSGSFLLEKAIAAGADIFLTADFKYHQFFDAEGKIIVADIGHYETEQFTIEIFSEIIKKKFPNFALHLSKTNTNPLNYYF